MTVDVHEWTALLRNGEFFPGTWPELPKDKIVRFNVRLGQRGMAIAVPEGRRLIYRKRPKQDVRTGEVIMRVLVALEPLDDTKRLNDTYGWLFEGDDPPLEFLGYRFDDERFRPPQLTEADL